MVCHVLHVFVWKVSVVAMLANVLKDEQITYLLKDVKADNASRERK
jgi:hypothetical protein